ncbi:Putative cytochrome P450 120, partial [Durusdinium trenchii]
MPAAAERSWVHREFWPARPGVPVRFCRRCNAVEPSLEEVQNVIDRGGKPRRHWKGACGFASTSAMVNHMRDCHEDALPETVSTERSTPSKSAKKVDLQLMREWVIYLVLGCLLPFRLVHNRYVKAFLSPRLPGLGGKHALDLEFKAVMQDLREKVLSMIRAARDSGCRFTLSADTWKPKMKRRKHYLACHLDWTQKDWSHTSVCIYVGVAEAPRTGDRYTELFKKALESVELTPEHIQASVSDHEGAIRKGLRGLGAPLIGCGCHCLQLCCKHALPDLKERTKKRKSAAAKLDSDSSSSDTSDESSSSSSSSSSEAEVAEKKAPMAPGGVKGPKGDPASVECKAKLKESFSRYRSIVRYFASHDDMYNEMYSAAAQAEVPCVAYQHETPTRWSSALLQIVSVIRNNAAHALLRSELRVALQFCAVLEPFRLGTKLLEGDDKALASLYLPVFHKCMETLEVTGSAQLPYPRELREMHGQGCKARELEVLPKHLLRFLHQDLNKVREKHFQGTTGEAWLLAASYVDPRFRGHSMWEKMSKKEVKEMICKMVVESHEKYPELRERLRKAAEDPMNHKLETLGRPEPKKTRGRGRGRGRGAGRQEKPKSTSEAILRDSACAAASGPAVRLQPGPRALKERTSAEDWLFGPQPDRRPAAEVAVLDDLKEVRKQVEAEMLHYERLNVTGESPLSWWRSHEGQMPVLAQFAQ